ncbi:MAG: right-handed parallel beta-helix repeat-containing protein [Phycisphaerales bacterium JB043]
MRHLLSIALALVTTTSALAGPLTPPGALTSTHKTLTEVEPRRPINLTTAPTGGGALHRISTDGSYYLTGEIKADTGQHAILIDAPNVTIDLNGYRILGGSGASDAGIVVDHDSATIHSGSIIKAAGTGILVNAGQSHVVRDVVVSECGDGLRVVDPTSTIRVLDSTFNSNTNRGAWVDGTSASFFRSEARDNGADGFYSEATSSLFVDCIAELNTGGAGFGSGTSSRLTGCIATANSTQGFSLGETSVLSECIATGNTAGGFDVGVNSVIRECSAFNNTNYGIQAGDGTTIRDCVATGNTVYGIFMNDQGSVLDSITRSNGNRGIRVGDGNLVRGCLTSSNGFIGISSGLDNRIENNDIGDHTTMFILGTGTVFIRNTIGSGSWSTSTDTTFGDIEDLTTPGTATAATTNVIVNLLK